MHLIRAAAGILAGGCAGRAGRHKGVARVVLAAWSRTCRRAMHLGCLVSTLSRVTPDGWRRQSGQDANNEPPVQVPVLRRVREEGRARVEGGQLAQVPRRGRGPAARPGLRPPAAAAAAASAQQGQAHAHGPRCAGPRTDEREGGGAASCENKLQKEPLERQKGRCRAPRAVALPDTVATACTVRVQRRIAPSVLHGGAVPCGGAAAGLLGAPASPSRSHWRSLRAAAGRGLPRAAAGAAARRPICACCAAGLRAGAAAGVRAGTFLSLLPLVSLAHTSCLVLGRVTPPARLPACTAPADSSSLPSRR